MKLLIVALISTMLFMAGTSFAEQELPTVTPLDEVRVTETSHNSEKGVMMAKHDCDKQMEGKHMNMENHMNMDTDHMK